MNKKHLFKTFIAITFAALSFVSCGKEKTSGICQSLAQGAQAAKDSGKNILLVYTADGDDASSAAFITDVLNAESFKNDVCSNFEVVHVDFGQKTYEKTVVHEEDSKKLQEQAEEFANLMQENMKDANLISVKATPSLYIFSKDKYFVTEVPFSDEITSSAALQYQLNQYESQIQTVNSYSDIVKNGTTAEKLEAINSLYDQTAVTYRAFIYDLVLKYMNLDKKNETGRLGKYTLAKADLEALDLYANGDPLAAAEKYSDVAQDSSLDPEQKQNAYYMAAYLLTIGGSPDYKPIIRYLKSALDAAPESDAIPHIQQIYDSFLQIVDQPNQ